jgi:sulfur relay (sulfurtransferase) DsrC/TusE family protein
METMVLNDTKIDVNEEGYLKNPAQWTPELAHQIAGEANITLTDVFEKNICAKHAEELPRSAKGNSEL